MTGMKEGAGEDPFADDDDESDPETRDRDSGGQVVQEPEDERSSASSESDRSSESNRGSGDNRGSGSGKSSGRSGRTDSDNNTGRDRSGSDVETRDEQAKQRRRSLDIPYKLRRDSVQDGRNRVPLFLQDDTKADERDALRELEERFDGDVSLTDLREALVVVGLGRLDEVEEQLEEWGYGMTFES